MKLYLWEKDNGNILSHRSGLTQEQIAVLHSFKEGDRVVIWRNTREGDVFYRLDKFRPHNSEVIAPTDETASVQQ